MIKNHPTYLMYLIIQAMRCLIIVHLDSEPDLIWTRHPTAPSDGKLIILLNLKTGFTEDASVVLCQLGPERSEEGLNLITRTRTDQT